MTNLNDLADRLEQGERLKIAHRISQALNAGRFNPSLENNVRAAVNEGSLDAALAVFNEVLPGWGWTICQHYADVYRGGKAFCGTAPTPAAALLAATCRAVAQKESE